MSDDTYDTDDIYRGNLFIKINDRKKRVRLAEHSAPRKIVKELEEVYYSSEENNIEKEREDAYVICQHTETKMLVKLYKWQNACEYFYSRGYTMKSYSKIIK